MLEPAGFRIERIVGIGTPGLYQADRMLRVIRNRVGDIAALPLLPLALPFVLVSDAESFVPFSLYAKAVKDEGRTAEARSHRHELLLSGDDRRHASRSSPRLGVAGPWVGCRDPRAPTRIPDPLLPR
ncbi:MAG: hypothetical protein R2862_01000 [Thermoanaerobaculia bacterium]